MNGPRISRMQRMVPEFIRSIRVIRDELRAS
jgi:hypothetical protein